MDSDLRDYIVKKVARSLPHEVRQSMRLVKKLAANRLGELKEMNCFVFPFSESELFGSAIYSPVEEGKRYEAFATSKDRIVMNEKEALRGTGLVPHIQTTLIIFAL